ncbi:MAG: hypothetical protein R3D60_08730 [Paracoccaceae bacterium]
MKRPRPPLFVERTAYRRRRLMDGARVLPVVGFILVLLPVLWTRNDAHNTANEAVYLFCLWLVLVIVAFILSRPLRAALMREERGTERQPPAAAPTPAAPKDEAP